MFILNLPIHVYTLDIIVREVFETELRSLPQNLIHNITIHSNTTHPISSAIYATSCADSPLGSEFNAH